MSVTAADLMSAPETPVQFVVGQLVPHGLTVLAGAPKTGKSYFALQAALAVARGERFLGRVTDQGNVLYLALEDGRHRLQRRLHQIAPAQGDLERVVFEFETGYLQNGLQAVLDKWYSSADRPRLVVIDTYGRIDPGPRGGQSEYSHVNAVLGPLQRWALQHEVAVLLVHHLRKGSAAGEMASADVFERILGSQGMLGIADAALVMLRGRRDHTADLHVTSRDFEEDAISLAVDPVTMRWSATAVREDPFARFDGRRQEVVKLLMSGPSRLKDIATGLDTTESNAIQFLNKAVRDGCVVKTGRGVYALEPSLAEQLGRPALAEGAAIHENAEQ